MGGPVGSDLLDMFSARAERRMLSALSIAGIAEYIRDKKARRIVIMNGAGISTSAGIPDFRSSETGLYSLLGDYNLPEPEDIFDIAYFQENPRPFYRLASELLPGRFRPTIVHSFIRLLEIKGLLRMCFTQNIDTLERQAGVSPEKLIEAHGSFSTANCAVCRREASIERLREGIVSNTPVECGQAGCAGFVKPGIVFFGEPLPESFRNGIDIAGEADLVIVMGTSLSVYPFAGLPQLASFNVPRVLINKEEAGDIGSRLNDVVVLDDCDSGVRRLAEACGWLDELDELWKATELVPEPAKEVQEPETKHGEDGPAGEQTEAGERDVAAELEALGRDVERISEYEKSLRRMVDVEEGSVGGKEDKDRVKSERDMSDLVESSERLKLSASAPE